VIGCGNCSRGLGSGQALVPEGPVPDWATWKSGGPVSHGESTIVDLQPRFVYPDGGGLANDFENEPGALWTGNPYEFNYNGVVMLGDAAVSSGAIPARTTHTRNITLSVGPTVAMAVGAGFGAALTPNRRAVGALAGALAGGILGLIFG
jgi:hypothetical protein